MTPKIKEAIDTLRATKKDHSEIGLQIGKAFGGAVYPMDILSFAVLNRSCCLLTAFCDLIEKRNFVAAAPMLRLQLDNLLRYRAAWLVESPHDFALKIFQGEKVKNLHDRLGNRMHDAYLVTSADGDFPQLKSIYEHTSGYVHLSEKHIFNMMQNPDKTPEVSFKVSDQDEFVPDALYLEALQAFMYVTGTLFRHLEGWKISKDKPAPPKST